MLEQVFTMMVGTCLPVYIDGRLCQDCGDSIQQSFASLLGYLRRGKPLSYAMSLEKERQCCVAAKIGVYLDGRLCQDCGDSIQQSFASLLGYLRRGKPLAYAMSLEKGRHCCVAARIGVYLDGRMCQDCGNGIEQAFASILGYLSWSKHHSDAMMTYLKQCSAYSKFGA